MDLKYMLHQIDLIDIYRAFHSKVAEYTFFSCAQGNILQDSPHAGSQSKPQWIWENQNHIKHRPQPEYQEIWNQLQGKKKKKL